MPSADAFLAQYQPQSAQQPSMPSADDFLARYQPKPKTTGQSFGDNLNATVGGAIKDIANDSLESLKNTATETGKSVWEPFDESKTPWPLVPADIAVKTLGKVGNAIGGVYGTAMALPAGALAASTENSNVIPAAASAIKNNLVPTDPRFTATIPPVATHQLAMQSGSDLANAAMMGKAGQQGAAIQRQQQGLPPAPKPYDPLKTGIAAVEQASQKLPGFLGDTGSGRSIDPATSPSGLSSSHIADIASRSFAAADNVGAVLTPDSADKWLDRSAKLVPQSERGMAASGEDAATKFINSQLPFKAKPMSLAEAQELYTNLGDKLDAETNPITGDMTNTGRALYKMQQDLRSTLTNAKERDLIGGADGIAAWREGQQLWNIKMRMADIERGLAKAESADVPSTAIKNWAKNYVNRSENLNGLPDEVVADLTRASKTGFITGTLKTLGSKLMSGVTGTAAGAAGGGVFGAPVGLAAGEAIGYPMRKAATALQRAPVQSALNRLGNSPVIAQATEPAPIQPSPSPIKPFENQSGSVPIPAAIGAGALAAAQSLLQPPATGGIGDQNKAILEHLKAKLKPVPPPQSAIRPPTPATPAAALSFSRPESNNNPNATNPNSTASGAFQFTNRTWTDMVRRYGRQTGIDLGDKNDPNAQAIMARKLAEDNIKSLNTTLGRMPTKGELYIAHVLGANGAAKLINADPARDAITLYPKQVLDANRSLFFKGTPPKSSQPRTVAELYQLLNSKV